LPYRFSEIFNKRSYRETLETAKNENFDVPSLSDYHYRVRQLDIANAEGFGFGGKYNLNWKRGTQIRTVQAHVRLEVVTVVETGRAYESEIEMLRKALSRLEAQKGLPFIADKAYDSVDIIQTLLDKGFEPAVRIKETIRTSIKHLYGSIKQKVGSSFNLLREDLARKAYYLLFALSTALCFNLFLRCSVNFSNSLRGDILVYDINPHESSFKLAK